MYLVGIDPGLAKIGFSLVHHDGGKKLVSVRLVETERADKAQKLAISADNNMRFHSIFTALKDFLGTIPPGEKVIVGIEGFGYTPGSGRNLLNTAQAVGVIKGALFAMGKIPFEFKPSEVKQTILGRKSGSKDEIQEALTRIYPNLPELLGVHAKGKWEHMADAVALAECAFAEYAQRRLYVAGIEA